jgi:hypothetical protein
MNFFNQKKVTFSSPLLKNIEDPNTNPNPNLGNYSSDANIAEVNFKIYFIVFIFIFIIVIILLLNFLNII